MEHDPAEAEDNVEREIRKPYPEYPGAECGRVAKPTASVSAKESGSVADDVSIEDPRRHGLQVGQREETGGWPYGYLVGMARAAGWLRVDGWWWHESHPEDHPLGEVIEIILHDHGVDLREPVPGEEAT